ncbi:STAS-like domain-containing protein [Citrobacter freundii]|uniref:STAS-like domain-containing protein n=1 Tax=Citrobacter freundii TaxID=546 RepID=UPI00397D1797
MKTIIIGKQFTDDPSGRFYTDGNGSGEEFREEILIPALKLHGHICIDISSNVEGYGSSFLSEAFGGVIKYGYYTKEELLKSIDIIVTENMNSYNFYKEKIIEYINNSVPSGNKYISTKEEALKKGIFKERLNYQSIIE